MELGCLIAFLVIGLRIGLLLNMLLYPLLGLVVLFGWPEYWLLALFLMGQSPVSYLMYSLIWGPPIPGLGPSIPPERLQAWRDKLLSLIVGRVGPPPRPQPRFVPPAPSRRTTPLGRQRADTNTPYHRQEQEDTCAIASTRMVVEGQTRADRGEHVLRLIASREGWYYRDSGTLRAGVERLLRTQGLSATERHASGIHEISGELARGRSVIVDVDARSWAEEPRVPEGVGHAVVVVEASRNDDGSWRLVVNDPDDEQGTGLVLNEEAFLDAWSRRGKYMVVAWKS